MLLAYPSSEKRYHNCLDGIKVLIQGNLFQKCAHFLYCSVLSLGGKVNTRRMSQPDMESIFTKIIYEIFRRTRMQLFLFTNSRKNWFQYVHCTKSIRNRNYTVFLGWNTVFCTVHILQVRKN